MASFIENLICIHIPVSHHCVSPERYGGSSKKCNTACTANGVTDARGIELAESEILVFTGFARVVMQRKHLQHLLKPPWPDRIMTPQP